MPPESSLVLSPFFTGLLFSGWIAFLALCAYIVRTSFRVRSDHVELFATKEEVDDGMARFERWLKDVEARHAHWQGEATAGRDELRRTVAALSSDISRVLGRPGMGGSSFRRMHTHTKAAGVAAHHPPGKHIATLLDNLDAHERRHPHWRIESLVRVMEGAVRALRHYVEDPDEREITWERPFAELHYPVHWNWEIDRKTGDPRGGHLFGQITKENTATRKKAAETLAGIMRAHLAVTALAEFTGWAWILKRGNCGQYFLPAGDAAGLDAINGRAACGTALGKGAPPLCFGRVSADRTRLLEPSPIEITGDVNGRSIAISLVFELHPLVAEYDDLKAYYPMTVGLFLAPDASGNGHAGQTPAAWPAEDRTVLWDRLLAEIPKLAGQLIQIAEQGPE